MRKWGTTSAAWVLRTWKWYQTQLRRNPVITQMLSSGVLWSTGDCLAQKIEHSMQPQPHQTQHQTLPQPQSQQTWNVKPSKSRSLDVKRAYSIGAFGACFVGPLGHYWYEGLEKFVRHGLRFKPGAAKFLAAKIILDTLVFGPIHLSAFFTYTGFISGHSLRRIQEDWKRDFLPAFLTEGAVWPAVQLMNFKFVAVKNQLLFVNFVCLLDSAFLSWYKYQQDAPWKNKLNDWIPKIKK